MSQKPFLRDLIYFDFDKTASIASQLEGGLIREIQNTHSQIREIGGGITVPFANIGGNANDSHSKMETQSIHHDLLVRVEQALFEANVAVDLNQKFDDSVKTNKGKAIEELHKILSQKPYVRVEGSSEFQDYHRIKRLVGGISQIEQLQSGISNTHGNSKRRKGSNKSGNRTTLQTQEQMLKGVVDLLMPNRSHLFVQPFESLHEFKVVSNLKSDCSVDKDSDNVLFHYGSQPDVKLTVFGLITSVPNSNNNSNLSKKTRSSDDATKRVSSVFDQLFDAIAPLEEYGQVAYYPSIIVYPLAVYRTIAKQG